MAGVVDDEPQMRKALRRVLTSFGFDVREFGGAGELLESLASSDLDCLLVDLHMPGINGFELLEILSERRVRFPVIVLTAADEAGSEKRARSLGAAGYLRKPVDRNDLLAAIESALAAAIDHPQRIEAG